MFPRTKAAKRLRADEIQYLKALADGKPAQRHIDEIIARSRISRSTSRFLIYLGWLSLTLAHLFGANAKLDMIFAPINFLVWASICFITWRRNHDWRTAEGIYFGVNALLPVEKQNKCLPISIKWAVILFVWSTFVLVIQVHDFFDEYMIVNYGDYWEIIP